MAKTNEFQRKLKEELRTLPEREKLAKLCLDVLARLADVRVQLVGREYLDARAQAHGLDAATLEGAARDVVTSLERGPENDVERARVVALAFVAFDVALEAMTEDERVKFARRFTWLELATPYRLFDAVAVHLSPEARKHFHGAVADAVVADQTSRDTFAANALRVVHLADADDADARDTREGLVPRLTDDRLRALLSGEAPASGTAASTQTLTGNALVPAPRTGFVGALRLVSGVALLGWLLRGIAHVLGLRVNAELSLVPRGVAFHRKLTMLGRVIVERKERFERGAILTASRTSRYPSLHLIVGALGLSIGIVAGGLVFVDGVRSGETFLLVVGAALMLAGAALDLGLAVVVPATRGEVSVELTVTPKRVVRISGVDLDAAESFLAALAR